MTSQTTEPAGRTPGEPELRRLLAGLTAVRDGDFGTRLPDDGGGLLGDIATVFNGMVDQLSVFTSEVTRVAREVGTEGTLGGQAEVPGVSGTWARSHRLGQRDGGQPHRPGPRHRPGGDGGRQGRPVPEDRR